jgi:hypothetical protein
MPLSWNRPKTLSQTYARVYIIKLVPLFVCFFGGEDWYEPVLGKYPLWWVKIVDFGSNYDA